MIILMIYKYWRKSTKKDEMKYGKKMIVLNYQQDEVGFRII